MASKTKSKSSPSHPAPIIVPPLPTYTHTHTMIILHGRGSTAEKFHKPLLETQISDQTFRSFFPSTKFIFPTSAIRRATFANRTPITQWFDNASVVDNEYRPELQIAGLAESTKYLHELISQELEILGARRSENVILGGLSQGACVAFIAALTWNGRNLGSVFGMAGRLPLRAMLDCAMGYEPDGVLEIGNENYENDIMFEDKEDQGSSNEVTKDSPGMVAIRALREELDLNPDGLTHALQTHFFLGHGTQDEKVNIRLGREAAGCLERIGCNIEWHEYSDLGHWYHEAELKDIISFLSKIHPDMVATNSPMPK